jgi:uncharacterized delta-60 repeat protein
VLDETFAPVIKSNFGMASAVSSVAIQPDGKVVVAGRFNTVGGVVYNNLCRLLATGATDTAFNPNVNADVRTVAVQTDGKILVGGEFTLLGNTTRNRIARLNADGTLDAAFNPDANGSVVTLVAQPDGKTLIGGDFTTVGGVERNRIARLNADGTPDPGFDPNADGTVQSLALQTNGGVVVGGNFTHLAGAVRLGVALVGGNGVLDPEFQPNVGSDVRCVALRGDGAVFVGGTFAAKDGAWGNGFGLFPRPGSASVSLAVSGTTQLDWQRSGAAPEVEQVFFDSWNGTGWTSLGAASRVTGGWRKTGLSLASATWLRARGRATGGLCNAGASVIDHLNHRAGTMSRIEVRSPTGTRLFTATGSVNFGSRNYWLPGGQTLVLTLTNAGNAPLTGLAASISGTNAGEFTAAALAVTTLAPGASTPLAITFRPTAGGSRSATVSIASSDLLQSPVVISLTGTGMHPLLGTSFLTSYDVRGIAIWPDGSTLIGDDKGLSRLRADGTLDPLITTALGGSYLMALAALRDGSMLIGGSFLSINRVPRKYVARLNPDGTLDSGFISITDLQATAIHPLPDGKVIVGTYNNADPGYVRHNADGSSDGSDGYGTVETIASQPDGRLLVGGKFSFIGGASRNRIARLNVDDTADATFNPNANGEVTCIAVQADGRIIIGGLFTTVGGVTRNRIARLNADGSVDVGFNPDANGSVLAITLQADGKILLGGTFATLGGQERKCLARLNADGSLDPTFNPGASSSVRCIALREDGGILVGGSLTSLGGQRVTGFACLSNNLPATRSLTATGPGQLDWARGGSAPELSRVVFERWDGTGWISLGDGVRVPGGWRWSGPALPAGSRVKASGMTAGAATGWVEQSATIGEGALPKLVVRDAGGAALAAGTTVEFGDQEWLKTGPARVFTLTNAGTATLSGLTVGVGGGHSGDFMVGQPAAITLAPGQSADFSVSFTPQGGEDRNALLTIASNDPDNPAFRLPVHGMGLHRDPWFTPGTNSKVNCLAVQPDGKILVGGTFLSAGGMARYGLARFHPDGSPDLAFNPNGTSSVDSISAWPAIRCLVVQGDGKILVGGEFGKLGGQTRAYLGRLNPDGTLDASFTPTPNGPVSTVVIQADGNILIGGTFTSVSASTHSRLARLAPDGTVDASFNPDANNHVKCIALQPDGKLVVGGDFTTISGKSYSGIARLNADGTVDTSFFSAIGLNTGIASISIQPDGAILMANDGTTTGLPSLRRRDSSGNWDNSLAKSNPDGSITSLATQADGKILIGGKFNWIQAGRRSAVARLNADGTLDPLFAPQATGYSTSVYALAIQPNGDVLIGGEFSRVGGVGRTCLARLPNNTAAIQSLAVTGTDRIDWTRGGGGPEVTAVTFDGWDGSAWVSLGKATRVAGGWSKTGLNLPAQGWLRARGQTTGGQFNGGNSLIEQIAAYGSGGYPALVVETAPGTPMAGGGAALDLGTLVVGASLTKTLTIRNDGTADLTGLAVSLVPNQSSPFTLLPPPVDSLAPGDSTTFTVIFATPTAGTATARLLIESNDLAQAPFEICLAATGVLAPEIGVEQPPGTGLAATGKCDFGMASWSHPTARSFTIRNAGTGPLNLGPAILSGADAGAFKLVITGTRSVVEPGGSTPLLVIFQPFATGPCAAHLSLPNNSTGAPELRLDLTGTGTSATPPALTLQPDGRAALRFWGVPGSAVAVERSTDLAAWFQVTTLTIGPDGTVTYADESPPPPHAFYRFGKR